MCDLGHVFSILNCVFYQDEILSQGSGMRIILGPLRFVGLALIESDILEKDLEMKNSSFPIKIWKSVLIATQFILLFGCAGNQSMVMGSGQESKWPGKDNVQYVDASDAGLGENTSGITYQPKSIDGIGYLWVVKNYPSELFRLVFNTSTNKWITTQVWKLKTLSGKSLDSEGVTKAEWDSSIIYIASEKEGGHGAPSKLGIIAYNTATSSPTHEWDLTYKPNNPDSVNDPVDSNKGWEGLTWVPDSDLVNSQFYDQRGAKIYNPADYPDHGSGLFLAGLEANGKIYVYALNHRDLSFKKIAVFNAGFSKDKQLDTVIGLEYDRSTRYLWIHCDNNCDNSSKILEVESDSASPNFGRFTITAELASPKSLKNSNFEGIAMFPDEECTEGSKSFFWVNDDGKKKKTLSHDLIPCGKFLH